MYLEESRKMHLSDGHGWTIKMKERLKRKLLMWGWETWSMLVIREDRIPSSSWALWCLQEFSIRAVLENTPCSILASLLWKISGWHLKVWGTGRDMWPESPSSIIWGQSNKSTQTRVLKQEYYKSLFIVFFSLLSLVHKLAQVRDCPNRRRWALLSEGCDLCEYRRELGRACSWELAALKHWGSW